MCFFSPPVNVVWFSAHVKLNHKDVIHLALAVNFNVSSRKWKFKIYIPF